MFNGIATSMRMPTWVSAMIKIRIHAIALRLSQQRHASHAATAT